MIKVPPLAVSKTKALHQVLYRAAKSRLAPPQTSSAFTTSCYLNACLPNCAVLRAMFHSVWHNKQIVRAYYFMPHSLPSSASVPPKPGEHAYYHAYYSGQSYRTEDGSGLLNFSLPTQLPHNLAWVTYHGIVPDKGLVPVQQDKMKSWYYH